MSCSFPPPLTEDQITAATDGDVDPSVQQHLSQCASCAGRFAQAQKVEQMLKSKLHRWDCPTPQQLGDYHLGLLSQADERVITTHLEQCTSCQAELVDLRAFLASDRVQKTHPPVTLQRRSRPRLGELIAQLLPRAPVAAMRGADSGPIVAEADGVTIFLEAQANSQGLTVTGQVVAEDQTLWTGALVELRQEGILQATAVVDEMGGFNCGLPRSGSTDLRITSPGGSRIVLTAVELDG
jgi:anti-sigma factor RsiW